MIPKGDSRSERLSPAEELPDLEAHILGSIMVNPTLLEHVAPRIKAEYFQTELHDRIYRVMLYKHNYGIPPNLQCLCREARPYGLLENVEEHTLLEIAHAASACIDESVKCLVERYEQQELDELQMQTWEALEKRGNVSQIIETSTPGLDDLETGQENLAGLNAHESQRARPDHAPSPALVGTRPLLAVDTHSHASSPRDAAGLASFARLGSRAAKPLALFALIVGVGLLAWRAGRWSAMVAPMPSTLPAVAPMQGENDPVASKVLPGTTKAANAEELALQMTTTAPAAVLPAGEAPQVPQEATKPSTPVAAQDRATPKVQARAPHREGVLIYAVHVSSFRNAAGAAVEVARLQARGYQAHAIRTDLKSKGVWYRVYVGQYATQAEAQQARAEILNRTDYADAWVRTIF